MTHKTSTRGSFRTRRSARKATGTPSGACGPSRVPPKRGPALRGLTLDRFAWPAVPTADELQQRAVALFRRQGIETPVVVVEVSPSAAAAASVIGLSFGTVAIAKIVVRQDLLFLLDSAETEFVLAHETVHVRRNHMVGNATLAVVRALCEDAARKDPSLYPMLALYDLWKLLRYRGGELPLDAVFTRDNELEADYVAVMLTGDADAARRVLHKIVGGDLSAASHVWRVLEANAPVMSIQERLEALNARLRERSLIPW